MFLKYCVYSLTTVLVASLIVVRMALDYDAAPKRPVIGETTSRCTNVDHSITDLYIGGLYPNREHFAPQQSSCSCKQLPPGPLFIMRESGTGKEYAIGFCAGLHSCGISKGKASSEVSNASGGVLYVYVRSRRGAWRLDHRTFAVFQFLGTTGTRVVARVPEGVLQGLTKTLPKCCGGGNDPGRILAILDDLYEVRRSNSPAAHELHRRLVVAALQDLTTAIARDWNKQGVWTDQASYSSPADGLPDVPPSAPIPLQHHVTQKSPNSEAAPEAAHSSHAPAHAGDFG